MKRSWLIFLLGIIFSSCKDDSVVVNAGISGNNTKDLLNRVDKDLISLKPQVAAIMIGTNDMINSRKFLSYEEYTANLTSIIVKLQKENIKVILIAPPPVDTTYLFERHSRKLYVEEPNLKLDSIAKICAEIAKKFSLPFINIFQEFKNLHAPLHNKDAWIQNEKNSGFRDGVHPTAKGHQIIAEKVFECLEQNNWLSPKTKIVCFGDSNTYGYQVEGAGTSEGLTYPAQLKALILGKYPR